MTSKPSMQDPEPQTAQMPTSTSVTREPDYFPEIEPEDLPEPLLDDEMDYYDDNEDADASVAYQPAPFVTYAYDKSQVRCTRCGSPNLTRGYVVDYAGKFEAIRFANKRSRFGWLRNMLLDVRPWKHMIKLQAEACRDCGAVIMVVDPSHLRRMEMRQK